MHTLINELVAIDRKAREIVAEAEALKNETLQKAELDASRAKAEYQNLADKHIVETRQSFNSSMEERQKAIQSGYTKALDAMNQHYQQNRSSWVQQIVDHIIG